MRAQTYLDICKAKSVCEVYVDHLVLEKCTGIIGCTNRFSIPCDEEQRWLWVQYFRRISGHFISILVLSYALCRGFKNKKCCNFDPSISGIISDQQGCFDMPV